MGSKQNKESPFDILKGYRDEIRLLEKRETFLMKIIEEDNREELEEQVKEILKKILDLKKACLRLEENYIKKDIDSFTINRKNIKNVEKLILKYKCNILLIGKRNNLLSRKIANEAKESMLWSIKKNKTKATNCLIYKEFIEEHLKMSKKIEENLKLEESEISKERKKTMTGKEILKIREKIRKYE